MQRVFNIILTLLLFFCPNTKGAELKYSSPVPFKVMLAGNFAEPRPNHFHGGIDVKTERVEGKPILSVADGYVSRITTNTNGTGNTVYITHPDGNTTVYCHLQRFVPKLENALRRHLYKMETNNVDVFFHPSELPVSRSELIALSGNTGFSTAPHLHLELHDTKSWDLIDPLSVLSDIVSDKTPPMAQAITITPVEGYGVLNTGMSPRLCGIYPTGLNTSVKAWGRITISLLAADYMEESYNHFGVRDVTLLQDNDTLYHSSTSRIAASRNRQVNSWGDLDFYSRRKVWYLKSYCPPGLNLGFINTNENKGVITISENKDYHFHYILTDYFGNTSTYDFTITGEQMTIPEANPQNICSTIMYGRPTNIVLPLVHLFTREGLVASDTQIVPEITYGSDYSCAIRFSRNILTLFHPGRLSLRLRKHPGDPSKLYLVSINPDGKKPFASKVSCDGEWATANIANLSLTYELAYDDQQPIISIVGTNNWQTTGKLFIKAEDKHSGISSIKAWIDDRFVISNVTNAANIYSTEIRDLNLSSEKSHTLRIQATDHCGNIATFSTQI